MGKFAWQDGFGSFTYSRSQIDEVSKYILNQTEHHKKRTFKGRIIYQCFEKMKLIMMKDIYLNGMINYVAGSAAIVVLLLF